jgi:hypothetical protein
MRAKTLAGQVPSKSTRSLPNLYEIPISRSLLPSRFFMAFYPSFRRGRMCAVNSGAAMFLDSTDEQRLAGLEQRLRRAHAITPELMLAVMAQARPRFAAHGAAATAAVNRLIEFELPQWRLRRIVHEDGAWHCSLSRLPHLPFGLGDIVEASHEVLALAIVIALLDARRAAAVTAVDRTAVPKVRAGSAAAACCDNFA